MFSYFCFKKRVIKHVILYYIDNTFLQLNFKIVIKLYTVIKALAVNRNMKIRYRHFPTGNISIVLLSMGGSQSSQLASNIS